MTIEKVILQTLLTIVISCAYETSAAAALDKNEIAELDLQLCSHLHPMQRQQCDSDEHTILQKALTDVKQAGKLNDTLVGLLKRQIDRLVTQDHPPVTISCISTLVEVFANIPQGKYGEFESAASGMSNHFSLVRLAREFSVPKFIPAALPTADEDDF